MICQVVLEDIHSIDDVTEALIKYTGGIHINEANETTRGKIIIYPEYKVLYKFIVKDVEKYIDNNNRILFVCGSTFVKCPEIKIKITPEGIIDVATNTVIGEVKKHAKSDQLLLDEWDGDLLRRYERIHQVLSIWGDELIPSHCMLNIRVEGSSVIIESTVQDIHRIKYDEEIKDITYVEIKIDGSKYSIKGKLDIEDWIPIIDNIIKIIELSTHDEIISKGHDILHYKESDLSIYLDYTELLREVRGMDEEQLAEGISRYLNMYVKSVKLTDDLVLTCRFVDNTEQVFKIPEDGDMEHIGGKNIVDVEEMERAVMWTREIIKCMERTPTEVLLDYIRTEDFKRELEANPLCGIRKPLLKGTLSRRV